MVFPLPYDQVSCGERCPFHVKAVFFATYFASLAEPFPEDWRRIRKQPGLDAVQYLKKDKRKVG